MDSTKSLHQFAEYMKGRVSESTLRVYTHALNHFFAAADGRALTPELAQLYLDSLTRLGKSPSTVGLRAHAIMNFFKWKKMDVCLRCPSVGMRLPEYLKPYEITKVIKACRTQLERVVVIMLCDTAVRIGELLSLTLDDIDWDSKTITIVGKGGREQEVNVSDKALRELKRWLSMRCGASKKVFLDLDYYAAWSMLKSVGKRAGIKVHPHIFRHSRAVQLLRNRVPINIVSQHLRHKSVATTIDIYGQFTTPDVRDQLAPWEYE